MTLNVKQSLLFALALSFQIACGGDGEEDDPGPFSPMHDGGIVTATNDGGVRDGGTGDGSVTPTSTGPSQVTAVTRSVDRSGTSVLTPVVLFDDGWAALKAVGSALQAPLQSRRSEPDLWAKWRRTSVGYEYQSSSGTWKELDDEPHPPLPRGHRFDALYKTRSVPSSGDSVFTRSAVIEFRADGTFWLRSQANSSLDGNLTTATVSPEQRGSYSINGYLLQLDYASGKSETRGLVSGDGNDDQLYIEGSLYMNCETRC